jgi:4-hydroxy-tetrahydrodipicolinate reductase
LGRLITGRRRVCSQGHEAGASSQPYVDGALLAIRKVGTFIGLKRGLDSIMDFN